MKESTAIEVDKKLEENAALVKELAKADPSNAETFDKLQKSDNSLEDLKKVR